MKRISLVAAFVFGLFLVLGSAYLYPALARSGALTAIATHVPFVNIQIGQTQNLPALSSRPLLTPEADPSVHPPKPLPGSQRTTPLTPAIAQAGEEDGEPAHLKPFDEVVQGTQRLEGLFTLYRERETGRLYVEVRPDQLNVNYLCTITLESGLGESGIYSGLPLADFLFTFRRVNDRLQFIMPNVYFRTSPDDPQQRSVQRAFSQSVLQALPIRSIHPQRKSLLIDMAPLLLNDLPGLTPILSQVLGASYTLDASKSYFSDIKTFPLNVELESVYGFSGSGAPDQFPAFIATVPDSRTFSLRVRYSFSRLPAQNQYQPRLADDRIGYFVTAYQNLSDRSPKTPFVRYINRWHLEKQDPKAPLSPPKQPIVFWIENTVPLEYRDAVREGILMWNKAFEQAGFLNAIEARQMPDQADWDPADIRYNTIRWVSSFDSTFLGLGPSRVNPLTGEILDADILIDASFARYAKQQYESLSQQDRMQMMPSLARLTGNPNLCRYGIASRYVKETVETKPALNPRLAFKLLGNYDLCYGQEASRQLAIGSMALTMLQNTSPTSPLMQQYVQEFLRSLIAHEVGHTLGLRHNFRASSMLPPEQLNNPEMTRSKGLTASVMDYAAVNLAPEGIQQGDFFTHTIGPYDIWAIEYGYKPSGARSPVAETRFLSEIARRAPEPHLAYATDEDLFANLDPQAHAFDLSSNLLTYAPWQLENARQMWQRLDQRYPQYGESFNDVRIIFDEIYDYYFQYASFLASYIGGQSFNRYRAGDAAGRLPFEPIPLDQQKQALSLLQKYVFDETMFRFSPNFVNKLAPSRWNHWGQAPELAPLEYPIYDRVLLLQAVMLHDLLSNERLSRLRDAELRTHANQALTIPDLFNFLQTTIWQEVLQPQDNLKLSSLRRGLQREHLNLLVQIVLRKVQVPEDARTLAWYELKQLRSGLENTLRRKAKEMDVYTRAHLEETSDRIAKALDAKLQSQ